MESVEWGMGNGDFSGETRMSLNWMAKRLNLGLARRSCGEGGWAGSSANLLRHAGRKQKYAYAVMRDQFTALRLFAWKILIELRTGSA